MSAVQALKAARAAGVRLRIDSEDLALEADAAPPPSVIDLLTRQKSAVIALLRMEHDSWSGEDWRAFFDERAGIAEFARLCRESVLTYIEEQGLIVCQLDGVGRRTVTLVELAWATAPGDPNAGALSTV